MACEVEARAFGRAWVMTPFKVACEHCDASFKINDASKIGKRVKCPRCGEAFTIPGPAAEEDDEFDDVDEPPAKPVRRIPAKTGGRRSRKVDKKENSPVVMWVGSGVGFVFGLVAMLWLTGFFSSGAPAPVATQPAAPPPAGPAIAMILDRLPMDTEVVMHFRIKDAMASPLVAGLRTPEFDAQLKGPNPLIPGTTVSGIETITLAMSNVTTQLSEQKRLAGTSPPKPGANPLPEPLVLVTLNDPLTPEFMNLPPESAIKHGSVTIYRIPQTMMPGTPPCLAIIEPRIVALGSEQQLMALVDQPSGNGATADFQLLDGRSHVAMAICPRNIVQQVERLAVNNIVPPDLHRALHQFVTKGGKAAALQLSLTSDVEAGVSVQAADSAKVAELQAAFEEQVKAARDQIGSPAAASNPMLAQFKPVVEGIKVATAGDRVSASAVLPKDTVVGFGQMAMAFAPMPAMMNGGPSPGLPTAPTPAAAP
jgi:predicted Zn finger-like uncharacterized protein